MKFMFNFSVVSVYILFIILLKLSVWIENDAKNNFVIKRGVLTVVSVGSKQL